MIRINGIIESDMPIVETHLPRFGEVVPLRAPNGNHGLIIGIDTLKELNRSPDVGYLIKQLIDDLEAALA